MKNGKDGELKECVDGIFKSDEDRENDNEKFGGGFSYGFSFGMGFCAAVSMYLVAWTLLVFMLVKKMFETLLP